MSTRDYGQLLQESPLGIGLDAQDCAALAAIMQSRQLEDGELLIGEGGRDDSLYLVKSGRLAVTRDATGGDRVTLHVMKAGDLAGEMGFVTGDEHIASLNALGPTEVLVLSRANFEALVDTQPQLVYQVMRSIARSVHNTLSRLNQQFIELQNYVTKTHGRY